MVHGRSNESRFHVRGFIDEGTTTTPFDMVVLNKLSRFHLAMEALKYVPRLRSKVSDVIDMFNRKLYEHHVYIREHLEDMPEIKNWHWTKDFTDPDCTRAASREPRWQPTIHGCITLSAAETRLLCLLDMVNGRLRFRCEQPR